MRLKSSHFKSIVAAAVLTVGISLPAQAQETRLDELFGQLEESDPTTAPWIEEQIRTELTKTGSPALDLLYRRGGDALDAGNPDQALEHLTALVDHAPDFAEGHAARAIAYYQIGLYGPALLDIETALALEPRHFGAMLGLAAILAETGQEERALEVFRQVLAIHPHAPDVARRMETLQTQLEGRDI